MTHVDYLVWHDVYHLPLEDGSRLQPKCQANVGIEFTACRPRRARADREVRPLDVTYQGHPHLGSTKRVKATVGMLETTRAESILRCASAPIHEFHTVHPFKQRADQFDLCTAGSQSRDHRRSERGSSLSDGRALAELAYQERLARSAGTGSG